MTEIDSTMGRGGGVWPANISHWCSREKAVVEAVNFSWGGGRGSDRETVRRQDKSPTAHWA